MQERNFNRSAYPINDLSPAPCGQVGGTVAGFTEERNPQYQPPPPGEALRRGFWCAGSPLTPYKRIIDLKVSPRSMASNAASVSPSPMVRV
ncbi:MAG TPA: hypothetical protein QF533_07155, partial [Nitrospinota bacterium]|nr:hypothetical protein [Nitrospinota bacterium]